MPEPLQQKVDRMTAGMEVTVTFGGTRPGTVTGPVTSEGGVLFVVGRPVRFNDGRVNPFITAIDMPDPECPFTGGERVQGKGEAFTATGCMTWCEECGEWEVEGLLLGGGTHGYVGPVERVVPPEPAEPDCPAILVTYPSGKTFVVSEFTFYSLSSWITSPDVATVQALRPAEYLRGGE